MGLGFRRARHKPFRTHQALGAEEKGEAQKSSLAQKFPLKLPHAPAPALIVNHHRAPGIADKDCGFFELECELKGSI